MVQDLKIVTDPVEYRREGYDSPAQQQTYRGALPAGVKGEFGSGINSLMLTMKHVGNLSEPQLLAFLQNVNVRISPAYLSALLTDPQAVCHTEQDARYRAGLECGASQQSDDTSARVNGENHSTQVICKPLYTAYFTTERKARLSVVDVLRNVAPRRFLSTAETMELLEQ